MTDKSSIYSNANLCYKKDEAVDRICKGIPLSDSSIAGIKRRTVCTF